MSYRKFIIIEEQILYFYLNRRQFKREVFNKKIKLNRFENIEKCLKEFPKICKFYFFKT